MSKHKNKNRTPKKTFLDAMREIEPSLTEDNLFSEKTITLWKSKMLAMRTSMQRTQMLTAT